MWYENWLLMVMLCMEAVRRNESALFGCDSETGFGLKARISSTAQTQGEKRWLRPLQCFQRQESFLIFDKFDKERWFSLIISVISIYYEYISDHFMNKIELRQGLGIRLMQSDFPKGKHCFASDFLMTDDIICRRPIVTSSDIPSWVVHKYSYIWVR